MYNLTSHYQIQVPRFTCTTHQSESLSLTSLFVTVMKKNSIIAVRTSEKAQFWLCQVLTTTYSQRLTEESEVPVKWFELQWCLPGLCMSTN